MRCPTFAFGLAVPLLLVGQGAARVPDQAAPATAGFGIDEAGMDRGVRPGDDFYLFANGGWSRSTPISSHKSSIGVFDVLGDLSQQRSRAILEEAAHDPASKIGTAYAAYLDSAAIEAKGLAPIKPWLDEIRALDNRAGYAALSAKAQRNGVRNAFESFVVPDDKAPANYAFTLFQAGLGLPDRSSYLSADARTAAVRSDYTRHVANVLTLAGEGDAEARAAALVAFETGIAQASWPREASSSAEKTYNRMTIDQLGKAAPGFDFKAYLAGLGAAVDSLIVAQPSAITGIARLIGEAPLQVLRDQLLVRSLEEFADVLPGAFDKEQFGFFGTRLTGAPAQLPREQRATNFVTAALEDDVSRIYVARFFAPSVKTAVEALTKELVAAFQDRIDAIAWLKPETRAAARRKLASVHAKIGYPDRWRDYSALRIVPADAFGNKLRANYWEYDDRIAKLDKPVRDWEWGLSPMTVNAYAAFSGPDILFTAAMLQPPFFDPAADPAVNYGAIGAAIASQLARHVDSFGARYDSQGGLSTWWSEADFAAFDSRAKPLIAQYDAYQVLPDLHVNGQLTFNENLDDLAGLVVAFDAYKASLGGKRAQVIRGFTGEQRFFLAWAQMWRRNYREANLRRRILSDPHSPAAQRAWIVRNLDAWHEAFGVEPGQGLYLAPTERVRVWGGP